MARQRGSLERQAPLYRFTRRQTSRRVRALALPLKGKKSMLAQSDLFGYFACERLQLNERVLKEILSRFAKAIPTWRGLLDRSFLSDANKEKYSTVLTARLQRMSL